MTASKSELQKTIGQNIRKYREKRKLTQAKLAELTELSEGHIIQVEGGFKSLSVYALYQVANVLQVSVDSLVFGDSRPSRLQSINQLLASVSDDKLEKIEELLYLVVDRF